MAIPMAATLCLLSACGTVSEKITDTTGISQATRCAVYRKGLDAYQERLARGEALTQYDQEVLTGLNVLWAACGSTAS